MSLVSPANPDLEAAVDLVLEAVQKWRKESIGMVEFDRRTRFLHELKEITAAAIARAQTNPEAVHPRALRGF